MFELFISLFIVALKTAQTGKPVYYILQEIAGF